MAKLVFVLADGRRISVEHGAAPTPMHAAIRQNIPGIVAECGGVNACATCHVYVDSAWVERVGGPNLDEVDMLEMVAAPRRPESRLCCQIALSPALDGLVLAVPPRQ
jgi:2Fe-2S ferredoxin